MTPPWQPREPPDSLGLLHRKMGEADYAPAAFDRALATF